MKTIIVYYSYTNTTKKLAEKLSADGDISIMEIKDVNRPGVFKAYTKGCFAAIKGNVWPIQPINIDLSEFDSFILMFPVWASNPPPAFNTFLDKLPNGKTFSMKAVSRSGKSNCKQRLQSVIKAKNGILQDYEDIRV